MSTAPVPYTETASFQSQQNEGLGNYPSGVALDNEFSNVSAVTAAILARLALIQRSDGALANGSVGLDQLSPGLVLGGIGAPAAWAPFTPYQQLNSVIYNAAWYWCSSAHTSSAAFDPTQWTLIYQFTVSAVFSGSVGTASILPGAITTPLIALNAVGSAQLAANCVGNGQLAVNSVGTSNIQNNAVEAGQLAANAVGTSNIQANAITTPLIHANAVGAAQLVNNCVGNGQLANNAVGTANIQASAVTSAQLAPGCVGAAQLSPSLGGLTVVGLTPIGAILPFGGAAAPSLWMLAGGQAVSRTTYTALFAVYGTTYGPGDGSTTFNVPDLRDRVIAGVGNMNGAAANRLTVPNSGITSTTLGAAGGSECIQGHAHGIVVPHGVAPASTTDIAGAIYGDLDGDQVLTPESPNMNTNSYGAGTSQNVQPTIVLNYIIFAGA